MATTSDGSTLPAPQPRDPAAPPDGGLPATVKGLSLVSLFNDFASEMVYPLLPAFITSLGGGPALLGALDGASDLTSATLKWLSGRWADRAGWRKPLVLIGYGTALFIRPFIALAGSAANGARIPGHRPGREGSPHSGARCDDCGGHSAAVARPRVRLSPRRRSLRRGPRFRGRMVPADPRRIRPRRHRLDLAARRRGHPHPVACAAACAVHARRRGVRRAIGGCNRKRVLGAGPAALRPHPLPGARGAAPASAPGTRCAGRDDTAGLGGVACGPQRVSLSRRLAERRPRHPGNGGGRRAALRRRVVRDER